MLKSVKRSALRMSRHLGLLRLIRESEWRQRRLLILCYHGIALEEEHRWRPNLYMTKSALESRFELLRRERCTVLPLEEAIQLLYAGELPKRAVAITFDDGTYDFLELAYPLLEAYGYPATVYLSTYYCEQELPVFHLLCSYMLWKRAGNVVRNAYLGDTTFTLDLRTRSSRAEALKRIVGISRDAQLAETDKAELAKELAALLDVDFEALRSKRVLHLLNPAEVARLANAGIDIQLHTHRHRSPSEKSLYQKEIRDNRSSIRRITGTNPVHYCYPSGVVRPEFLPWLAEEGVVSATTCRPGLATRASDPLLLPRLVDHQNLAPVEFLGWVGGLSAALPRRTRPAGSHHSPPGAPASTPS